MNELLQLFRDPDFIRQLHIYSDVDTGVKAQHHTLGKLVNQAAAGNHIHVTGGGSNVVRDRIVASGGEIGLTLGAVPVANSPLIWKNGTLLWPGIDYSITGSNITFPALSSGDVIKDWYVTASSSAAGASLVTSGLSVVGSLTTYINNLSSVTASFPSGIQVGDLLLMITSHGWQPALPAGWTSRDSQNGSNVNGRVLSIVATSTEVSAGNVTETYSGIYYGEITLVAIRGGTTVRDTTFVQSAGGSSPVTVNSLNPAVAGDLVIYCGGARTPNETISFNRGSILEQRSADAQWGAGVGKEGGLSSGTVTVAVSHAPAPSNGYYDGLILVGP